MSREPTLPDTVPDTAGQPALLNALQSIDPPGAPAGVPHCAAEMAPSAPPATRLALFELSGELIYPNLEGAGTSHYTVEPTPYAAARMVWCHQFDADDKDAGNHPIRGYGGTSLSKEETIYHPAAFRNSSGYAIGHPAFAAGDRVFCVFNRQSGRWEIVAPALDLWRFELTSDLPPGGSATACLLRWHDGAYAIDADVELTVHDAILGTLRGWAKTDTIAGSIGYARYMPDSGRWEIVALEQKARWIRFQLAAALGHDDADAQANVLDYWDGIDPDPSAAGVTVNNCAASSQYLFAGASGAIGLACYDPALDQYHIVQLE